MRKHGSRRVGFLITHGTDTMSWGLSALRYILKNLPANIAITGSQIPLSLQFSSSDGYTNLENSVKLLTQLSGPEIFVVFNNGQVAFQENIWKIHKWSADAFQGRELGKITLDEVIIHGQNYPLSIGRQLDKLYLIRTGGSIESEQNEEGVLTPTGNLVSAYISYRFTAFFKEYVPISLMAVDSSDLTLKSWFAISERIAEECQELGYTTYCDFNFDETIRLVTISPMTTEEEYHKLFGKSRGIILYAYGSGTINCDIKSGFSPLPAIKKATEEGKTVVMSSHTPFGVQDYVYENSWKAIKAGATPIGDFSIAHSQIKLSYILGHLKEIKKVAKECNIPFETLIKIAFLSGVEFRSYSSRKRFEQLLGYPIPRVDPFFNVSFESGLRKIVHFQSKKEKQLIRITSLEEFENAFNNFFKSPQRRRKWAIILKPDTVIGTNRWGELIDAAENLSTITTEFLDWNVVLLELSLIDYNSLLEKVKELAGEEDIGNFFRSFRYVIIEGGRQSLYDAKSFDEISEGRFSKKDYLHLLRAIMFSRMESSANPALFICLGQQGVAEALRDYLVSLIDRSKKLAKKIAVVDAAASEQFVALMKEIETVGNEITVKRGGFGAKDSETAAEEIVAKGFREKFFAVKTNELPEVGQKKLSAYSPPIDSIPEKLWKKYQALAKYQTGLLEDFLLIESLDVMMLHNDEVNEEAILFMNWALTKLSNFVQEKYELLQSDSELVELTALPHGLEILGATLHQITDEEGDFLTEIAGLVIYYLDHQSKMIKRDYSLQFHPELLGEIRLLQKKDLYSKTPLELANELQLLLTCIQAGFIQTTNK